MPKRKATTELSRPARKSRRMFRRKTKAMVARFSPFPNKFLARLRYCETVSINAGVAGTPAWHIFSCTSIHDPNHTGVGHQPYGHDQISVLYNHYTVLGSKISATFIAEGGNAQLGGVVVGIARKDDTTMEGNFDTIREARNSKFRLVNYNKTATVKHTYSMKKNFSVGARAALRAQFGANPTEQMYWQVYAVGTAPGADPSPVTAIVTIDYIVLAEELKDLGPS